MAFTVAGGCGPGGGRLCLRRHFRRQRDLVNLISPPASHARLLSLFYVIAYIANWVPILLGIVVDRVDLQQATHLLFLSSTTVCLLLAWMTVRVGFPR